MDIQTPRVGVATFVVNSENKILLGNRINSHGHNTWGLPGGHLEFMETIEECAIRETFEETNLKVKNIKLLNVVNDFFKKESKHYVTIFTIAREFEGDIDIKEKNKCKCWKWFKLKDLPENLFQPLATFLKTYKLDL